MLFGIGEGLGFIFWHLKTMDFPFLGGRIKPDILTANICRHLGLDLTVKETRSVKKAWANCVEPLEKGQPVGLKLDCFHLEYFRTRFHFAAHYVALYGYDKQSAFLVDTRRQGGPVTTTHENLRLARSEKGPMSSRNLSFTIGRSHAPTATEPAVRQAIRNNAQSYLNPAITNLTYKGILKTSREIIKWFERSPTRTTDFQTTAALMERGGTGGASFRNLYRDFLQECVTEFGMTELAGPHAQFCQIAEQWTQVAELFHQAGESDTIDPIHRAAAILASLSEQEFQAMSALQNIGI